MLTGEARQPARIFYREVHHLAQLALGNSSYQLLDAIDVVRESGLRSESREQPERGLVERADR